MGKFNNPKMSAAPTVAKSPMTTTATTRTAQGGIGYTRDTRSELLMLAVSNMVGEGTFYETAGNRDNRFRDLVRAVAVTDPAWMVGFIPWLRTGAKMRSASIVAAAESVKARLDASLHGTNRQFIDAACQRPDEPGEFLAYWTSHYGRRLPMPVKRGVADAVRRMYNGKAFIKYDSDTAAYRFADVLELVHASADPEKPWQGDLFRYMIDKRHNRDNIRVPEGNNTIAAYAHLMAQDKTTRRQILLDEAGPSRLAAAGMTWEALAGWLQGPMDKAAWEAIIPSMQPMALVRNLRNFDQAGVSDTVADAICARLADPVEIERSRMFPYQLFSAYKAAPSLRWGHALDKALGHACANIPALDGRTLVLVDTSGSMQRPVSDRSQVQMVDVGALFGVALALRGASVDLFGWADSVFPHNVIKGGSVLKQTEAFNAKVGSVGHGTDMVGAIRATYRQGVHTRVVVVSDMQVCGSGGYYDTGASKAVPDHVPLFGINMGGYKATAVDLSKPNRFETGGFSDKMFTVMDLLSRGKDAGWPWDTGL
jgi:hypothetical protein